MGILSGLYNARKEEDAAKGQENAANRASDLAGQASQAAIAEQRRQYDQTRADFAPYTAAGTGAVNRLSNFSSGNTEDFYTSPNYNFVRSEGQRDIGNSFAARGGAASGNALRALSQYNQDLASGQVNDWWNQQAGLANIGQGATGTVAGVGATATNNISNNLLGTAAAQGQYGIYGANARASGIRNAYAAINRGGLNAFKIWMALYGGGTNGLSSGGGGGGAYSGMNSGYGGGAGFDSGGG